MGLYYIALDREAKEYINPCRVEDGGAKHGPVCLGRFSNLLAYLLLSRRWTNAEMINDSGEYYDEIIFGPEISNAEQTTDRSKAFKDITEQAIADFNKHFSPESCDDDYTIKYNPKN